MDRNDIIRMAREAGIAKHGLGWTCWEGQLERFAALVAAKAMEGCYEEMLVQVAAEREACAKVCSEMYLEGDMDTGSAADAIRARGNHANG